VRHAPPAPRTTRGVAGGVTSRLPTSCSFREASARRPAGVPEW
jgi:hypothetical protein